MSTNAKEVKQKKLKLFSKFSTKVYNRCRLCGRKRGYMRKFDICRICFREQAHDGNIPGVTKASW